MSSSENREMSAEVLDKPNEASKKYEEPLVEFKRDSTLEQFLVQKSGNETNAFTFMQILKCIY